MLHDPTLKVTDTPANPSTSAATAASVVAPTLASPPSPPLPPALSPGRSSAARWFFSDLPSDAGWRAWIKPAVLTGLALSAILHLSIGLIALVIVVGSPARSDAQPAQAGNSTSGIDIAVLTPQELGAITESQFTADAPVISDQAPSASPGLALTDAPGGSPGGSGDELGALGDGLGGLGAGKGVGIGSGEGGSGSGGARFFGVEARGSRFVYIVDISGSMQGSRIGELKRQLIGSIDGLLDNAQFMVFFFESRTIRLGRQDQLRWFDASRRNKDMAKREIREVQANGGTEPDQAFTDALLMKPRPDAIYFMTDGLFDEAVADRVIRANVGPRKITIHTIAFGERSSEPWMRRMAESSGGTYRFVDSPP